MNYLAHTLLSGQNEDLILGNFLADIVRKNEHDDLPPNYMIGFELHKAIDEFTDSHEAVKNITKILRPNHRKYAPVVSDILMDYVLGQCWQNYSDEALQNFADRRYSIISNNIESFPERTRPIISKMVNGNFLIKYTTLDGLMFTFEKIQEAARFPSDFTQAVEDLEENYEAMHTEFNLFFPDIVKHTDGFRNAVPID